jgi:predicted transposase YbfD/YdcC
VLAPAWIEFDGAAQVAQLRRTVTANGKKTVEVVYLITSDRAADPATLAAWVRCHWEIENRLHWVRDVTYQEDKSLVRTGNAPRVMAPLRSIVTRKGKKTVEVVYLITSSNADPGALAAWVRGHWEIENKLRWVRDVTYQEETSPTRKTSPWSEPGTRPALWQPCAAWPSASCAWTATRTSPPPTATTPATPSARSTYFKPHDGTLPGPWSRTPHEGDVDRVAPSDR